MATIFQFPDASFPLGLESEVLSQDLRESSIGPLIVTIVYQRPGAPFRVQVTTRVDLSPVEEATLNGIIVAHDPTATVRPGTPVADLQAQQPGIPPGRIAWARDGRKLTEGPGLGTGTLAYSDGTVWRRVADDALLSS